MTKHNGGYFRQILRVDMTGGTSKTEPIDDEFIENYVGGRGFAIKLLWDNLQKNGPIDPLGPENMLVVAAGPLTGVYLPSSGKNSFASLVDTRVATGLFGLQKNNNPAPLHTARVWSRSILNRLSSGTAFNGLPIRAA